ncbi:MAG TPA: hypothetical protein VNT01_12325 [Symbiobacteriaceae bacterium]|nr:hypothetical protein [Symbiobacteriaceae bacterium]
MGQEFYMGPAGAAGPMTHEQHVEMSGFLRRIWGEPAEGLIWRFSGDWNAIWLDPDKVGFLVADYDDPEFLLAWSLVARHGRTIGLSMYVDWPPTGDDELETSFAEGLEIEARSLQKWKDVWHFKYLLQTGTAAPLSAGQMLQVEQFLSTFQSPVAESKPGSYYYYSQGRNHLSFYQSNKEIMAFIRDWFDRRFLGDFVRLMDFCTATGIGLFCMFEPVREANWHALRQRILSTLEGDAGR